MKKRDFVIYRIVTALFSLKLLAGAISYFVKYDLVSVMFISPEVLPETYSPLAIAIMLGILAIGVLEKTLIKHLYITFESPQKFKH